VTVLVARRSDGPVAAEAPHGDAGVATVFAALVVGLLILVTGIGLRLGGAMIARQHAETAADLGALAGAARILQGEAAACARAAEVVEANHGAITSCTADGLDLLVQTAVPVPGWGDAATAKARAGPVTSG
jgi:secretion/DNA translocation related TadE-like protein